MIIIGEFYLFGNMRPILTGHLDPLGLRVLLFRL